MLCVVACAVGRSAAGVVGVAGEVASTMTDGGSVIGGATGVSLAARSPPGESGEGVCTVGALSAVGEDGGSWGCSEGAAGVLAGGQKVLSPGGGAGGFSGVGRLQQRLQGSQLEQCRPASLHSQRVRTSALHFPFLVQLQHDGSDSLWRRRSRGLFEATESVEERGLRMVVSRLGVFCEDARSGGARARPCGSGRRWAHIVQA